MTSWKTTLAGLISLGSLVVSIFWPQYTPIAAKVTAVAVGAGLVAARDNGVTSEQAGAKEAK